MAESLSLPSDLPDSGRQPLEPTITSLEIRKEVLKFFDLVVKEENSPMRSFKPPSSNLTAHISPPMSPTAVDDKNKDILGTGQNHMESQLTTEGNTSSEWSRQKQVLKRSLLRLTIWDNKAQACEEGRHNSLSINKGTHTIDTVEICFSEIGKALAMNDSKFKDYIDRIANLSKSQATAEVNQKYDAQTEPESKLIHNLGAAIDRLFELLHPLPLKKRKSTGNPPSMEPPRTKMVKSPSGGPTRIMKKKNDEDCVESKKRHASSSIEGSVGDSNSHKTSKASSAKLDGTEESALNLKHLDMPSIIPRSQDEHPKKIILKIASRHDAFREAANTQNLVDNTSSTGTQRPFITRIGSGILPLNRLVKTEEENMSKLVEEFSNLKMDNSQYSSTEITEKLLATAQIEEAQNPPHSNSEAHPASLGPEFQRSLEHFNSIIALIDCLPEWQILVLPAQKLHAKTAISMIYLSLLKEVLHDATEVSKAILKKCGDKQGASQVRRDIQFVSACVQRLSDLNERLDSTFHIFRLQLHNVVKDFKILDTIVNFETPPELDETIEIELNGNQTENNPVEELSMMDDQRPNPEEKHEDVETRPHYNLRRYYPLSLACYLSSDSNHSPSDSEAIVDTDFQSGSEELTVKDLF